MTEALIRGTQIVQIVPDGQDFAVHPSLEWQNDPTDAVTLDYSWDGMNFVAPPPLILADVQADAKTAITALKEQKKELPLLSEGFQVDANSLSSGAMAATSFIFASRPLVISSLTVSGNSATAVTIKNHHMIVGQGVAVSGAVETEFNITGAVSSVPDKNTFTYEITGAPSTPATGAPVANIADQPWFDNTGVQRFWPLEIFDDICRDVSKYVQDLTTNENALKALVDAATTVAEVDAIDITAGWPATGL